MSVLQRRKTAELERIRMRRHVCRRGRLGRAALALLLQTAESRSRIQLAAMQ